ncbi:tetratricopeptide repeat protein [Luteimonas terrae]|uniref:Tetratricopeptide repeat protein n=1 Tax=Luteimonas terrae TaxID=1530191 RepID=A0ABU1XV54_9GAMM|nr:hypothetical protein [Luteimonas terrae]MDR7192645.1 hypothetical protein [Luteimonas terrae]
MCEREYIFSEAENRPAYGCRGYGIGAARSTCCAKELSGLNRNVMKTEGKARYVRMLGGVAVLALLSGCATTRDATSMSTGDYDAMLSMAEAEIAAGRVDTGLIGFQDAGKADPTRKDPWVRIAQIEFNNGNYARAVVAAEEVLQRDEGDLVADGILTVSGLRIANQSLLRLQTSGALGSNTARREAETLVTTLRATMGSEIFQDESARDAARRRAPAASASRRPAGRQTTSQSAPRAEQTDPARAPAADPFKRIGGD